MTDLTALQQARAHLTDCRRQYEIVLNECNARCKEAWDAITEAERAVAVEVEKAEGNKTN